MDSIESDSIALGHIQIVPIERYEEDLEKETEAKAKMMGIEL